MRNQSARVLAELVRSNGLPVSRDELIEVVWSGIAVTDDSLVQCIKDIRSALADKDRQLIKTLVGRGYAVVVDDPQHDGPKLPRLFIEPFQTSGDIQIASDLSSELHDVLVARMAHRKGMRVLPNNGSSEAGDTVVTGSVRVKNDQASVSYQFKRGDDGSVQFNHIVTASGNAVRNLPIDVANSVAAQSRVHMIVHDGEEAAFRPDSELSFDELKAKAAWHMARFQLQSWDYAKSAIAGALKQRPDDATVLAMSASMATQMIPLIGMGELTEWADAALEQANRAIEYDPSSDYAFRTRGNIRLWLFGDHEAARRDCARALKLNPVFHLAQFTIAESEIMTGEMDKGIARLEAMMARAPFDPQSPLYYSFIALGWLLSDAYEKAFSASVESFDLWPRQPWSALLQAVCAAAVGKFEDIPDRALWNELPRTHFSDLPFSRDADIAKLNGLYQLANEMGKP